MSLSLCSKASSVSDNATASSKYKVAAGSIQPRNPSAHHRAATASPGPAHHLHVVALRAADHVQRSRLAGPADPHPHRVVTAVQCEPVTAKNVSRLRRNAYWSHRTQNPTSPRAM